MRGCGQVLGLNPGPKSTKRTKSPQRTVLGGRTSLDLPGPACSSASRESKTRRRNMAPMSWTRAGQEQLLGRWSVGAARAGCAEEGSRARAHGPGRAGSAAGGRGSAQGRCGCRRRLSALKQTQFIVKAGKAM